MNYGLFWGMIIVPCYSGLLGFADRVLRPRVEGLGYNWGYVSGAVSKEAGFEP